VLNTVCLLLSDRRHIRQSWIQDSQPFTARKLI
jgi:hypothetical protein